MKFLEGFSRNILEQKSWCFVAKFILVSQLNMLRLIRCGADVAKWQTQRTLYFLCFISPFSFLFRPSAAAQRNVETSIHRQMARLGVREQDLEESFARSSGPGGQHVNKVATAVTLRHRPSGISVTVQDSRSQARNRVLARERLFTAIEKREEKLHATEIARKEKLRRAHSRRPRKLKERILETKRKRSALKKLRGKIAE